MELASGWTHPLALLQDELVQLAYEGWIIPERLRERVAMLHPVQDAYNRLPCKRCTGNWNLDRDPAFDFVQPNELDAIRRERPDGPRQLPLKLTEEELPRPLPRRLDRSGLRLRPRQAGRGTGHAGISGPERPRKHPPLPAAARPLGARLLFQRPGGGRRLPDLVSGLLAGKHRLYGTRRRHSLFADRPESAGGARTGVLLARRGRLLEQLAAL